MGFISRRNDIPRYTCKFCLFLRDDHLDLESLKKAASWFNFTCNHAPPPTGHLQFCLSRRDWRIPHPRYTERDNSPPPSSWSTSYTIFSTSFSSVQKQNNTFSRVLWTFSWVYWEKDNECHNAVKTWTKKKNSLSASLREHFMRTRSIGPNLCFCIDGFHSDIIKL